jgi:hypothetical protein
MRRWYLPITVLGLGSVGVLGAFLYSDRGRRSVRGMMEKLNRSPEGWRELNDSLQGELDRIQAALDRIAESLDPHPELGR